MGLFDGVASAATGGLLDLAGGIFANNANKDIAQQAQAFSAQQSQAQMNFQERMRATQYQTQVDDLQKAGLNPMLAVTSGGGAGTPSGAAAVGQQAKIENPTRGLASSAATLANIKADLDVKDTQATQNVANTTAIEKQAQKTDAETASIVMAMPNISQQFKKMYAETLLVDAQREQSSAQSAKTKAETYNIATGEKAQAESKQAYYKKSPYNPFTFQDVVQGGNSAANLARSLNPLKLGK